MIAHAARRVRHACAAPVAALVALILACQKAEPPRASEPAATARLAIPAAPATAAPKPPEPAATEPTAVTRFRVQGVAADDVLNIRSNPDSSSSLLGTIPAGATQLEGIGAPSVAGSTRWQRVRHGGTVGWVNARFLGPDDSAPPEALPTRPPPAGAKSANFALLAPLICFGTEPFWAIRFGADGSARCEEMCEGPPGLRIAQLKTTPSGDPESFDLLNADQSVYLRAALRRTGTCSDGMSDLSHLYEFTGVGAPGSLSGCCRIEKAAAGEPRP
jgi:uncharacterized membrane protein